MKNKILVFKTDTTPSTSIKTNNKKYRMLYLKLAWYLH